MPTHAGAGVEGLEPEGLGPGGRDDVPEVDAEVVAEARHLVDEGDVDVAVGVLQQLRRLGLAGAPSRDDRVDEPPVEGGGGIGARLRVATDDLGSVLRAVLPVARVDPLG